MYVLWEYPMILHFIYMLYFYRDLVDAERTLRKGSNLLLW